MALPTQSHCDAFGALHVPLFLVCACNNLQRYFNHAHEAPLQWSLGFLINQVPSPHQDRALSNLVQK